MNVKGKFEKTIKPVHIKGRGGEGMERQLGRQAIAMMLYSRRFNKVSGVALDILVSLLSEVLQTLWRRAGRIAESQGSANSSFPGYL